MQLWFLLAALNAATRASDNDAKGAVVRKFGTTKVNVGNQAKAIVPGLRVPGLRPHMPAPSNKKVTKLQIATDANKNYTFSQNTGLAIALVGGYHFSGTSLVERLLSSQDWGVGLDHINFHGRLTGCKKNNCAAPEREGIFLTKAYNPMNTTRTGCELKDWQNTGECAAARVRCAREVAAEQTASEANASRETIWRDWAPFWKGCDKATARYLVEKDIPNLYWVSFHTHLWGRQRIAFVFVLRHPFGACATGAPGYCKNATERARYWLDAHEVAFEDLAEFADRAAVFQMERLLRQPVAVLRRVGAVLGFSEEQSLAFNFRQDEDVVSTDGNKRTGSAAATKESKTKKTEATDKAARRRLVLHKESVNAKDGLVEIERIDSPHFLARARSFALKGNPYPHASAADRRRLRVFCYEFARHEPLASGDCASPLLVEILKRPPTVDRSAGKCGWATLSHARQ